jgi:hypothetical protein
MGIRDELHIIVQIEEDAEIPLFAGIIGLVRSAKSVSNGLRGMMAVGRR